ncbi:Dimer-Tnp-hAT domain containing protein [Pyrenophora tritici-repentis]|nr:Dimer-Tnp-hAT domain containing protein [Pyrenophora tritici-repentis]
MANRPRRSRVTQTFAVPDEDDIYDNASIAPLDESGTAEDTDNTSLIDINERIASFLNDADSQSQSSAPPTPSPVIPATETGAQFLKRKRGSSTPHRGLGQKDKSVWKHARARLPYEAERDDHGHQIFYCAEGNCNWKGPSSNAARHLRKHAIFVGRFSATPSTIAQANNLQQGLHNMATKHAESSHNQTVTVLRNAAQKQPFRNALARFVTACSISHKSVVSDEFKALIIAVNPEAEHVLLRSSSSLSSRIVRNFRAQQEEVIRYLCDDTISCFHISTDTWKTMHGHKHFQAVNVQFVDQNGQLIQLLLDLVNVDSEESKTGAYLATLLIQTIKKYNLTTRLGWISSDNVGVNDSLIRAIEAFTRVEGINYWTEKTRRLRCIGHIINLATQAFMFATNEEAAELAYERARLSQLESDRDGTESYSGSNYNIAKTALVRHPALAKLRSFAVILRDDKFNQAFKTLAKGFPECPATIPKIPGETRWNGWLLMIEEAFRTRPILNALYTRYPDALELVVLTDDEWTLLEHVHNFLLPFKEVTLKAEGYQATLDCFQPSMEFLINHFEEQQRHHSKHKTLLAPLNTAWFLFSKYYALIDESGAYITAALLHPERRYKWLQNQWNTTEKKKWLKLGLQRAEALWHMYRDRLEPTLSSSLRDQDTSAAELSAFDQWQRQSAVVADSEDNFKAFIYAPPSRLPTLEGRQMTVIKWWAQLTQRQTFPALSQLAIDVLSAFAMSAESERTFSKARRTTSWERSQLSANTIRCSELLKDWSHRGVAYRLPNDYIDSNYGSDSEGQ